MGDVVNLRTHRKRAARQKAEERAAENRVIHGMSKADRAQIKSEKDKAKRELDLHRIDTGDGQ